MTNHSELIETLSRSAEPVQRLAPPARRALVWFMICAAAGWIAVWPMRLPLSLFGGTSDTLSLLALGTAILASLAAIHAALRMGVPGLRANGIGFAMAGAIAWLGFCLAEIVNRRWGIWSLGEGAYCFTFIVVCSVPMMALAIVALNRARPLHPNRALLAAGFGIAMLAAAFLSACHPFRLDVVDFTMHLAAMSVVVAMTALLGYRWVKIPAGKA
jgi:hypothetical protein